MTIHGEGVNIWGEGGLYPGGGLHSGVGVCIQEGVGQTLPPSPPKIHRILRDTVNQREVRSLLECIRFYFSFLTCIPKTVSNSTVYRGLIKTRKYFMTRYFNLHSC